MIELSVEGRTDIYSFAANNFLVRSPKVNSNAKILKARRGKGGWGGEGQKVGWLIKILYFKSKYWAIIIIVRRTTREEMVRIRVCRTLTITTSCFPTSTSPFPTTCLLNLPCPTRLLRPFKKAHPYS